jgi:hypothetical protein
MASFRDQLLFYCAIALAGCKNSQPSSALKSDDASPLAAAPGNDCDTGDPIDVMVPVGGWCVDKYPAVVCDRSKTGDAFDASCISNSNRNNGKSGNNNTHETIGDSGEQIELGDTLKTVIARDGTLTNPNYRAYSTTGFSKKGLVPTRFVDFYQAVSACVNAGKSLIPDAVFVAAAIGTHDPGPNRRHLEDGLCNTDPDEGNVPNTLRPTGHAGTTPAGADSCISNWGVEDMIGMFEWTDFPTRTDSPHDGSAGVPSLSSGEPWFANRGRGSVLRNSVRSIEAIDRAHIFGFRCARPRVRYTRSDLELT